VVDHLTRVEPERGLAPERVAAMGAALGAIGFAPAAGRRPAWESAIAEAGDAKAHLRTSGFRDREFRVVLEYVRQWGFL
jgi:hypothetical protein